MRNFLSAFQREDRAAAVIEVAILLPMLIGMMIAVLQVGLYLQAQNAVRGVGGEISRLMAVESQKNNQLSNRQIEDMALGIAVSQPYGLKSDLLDIDVSNDTTQDIDRVRKIDLAMSYEVPNILGFAKWGVLTIDLTKQAFVPWDDDFDGTSGDDVADGGDGTAEPDPGTGVDLGL